MDASAAAVLTLPPVSPQPFLRAFPSGNSETVVALQRAERAVAEHAYADALVAIGSISVPALRAPDLALRTLHLESWARMSLGELDAAAAVLERARALCEGDAFTDVDRAETLFRLGCVRQRLGKATNAVSLFTHALALAERSGVACDALRARTYEWRSRCYQVQRDWEAAQVDADRAHEHALAAGDEQFAANALFQSSLVAERRGETLMARYFAEQALDIYVRLGDRQSEARILNNLGGLTFLLGRPEVAVAQITRSYALSLELGNDGDAAQAISSLAQVHLRCGAPQLAEEQARTAIAMLEERQDFLDERGNVQLVLGRALLAQERLQEAMTAFAAAEWTFEQLGSRSHVAAVWTAQGDAFRLQGDAEAAAELYRRAVEALQDFNFQESTRYLERGCHR